MLAYIMVIFSLVYLWPFGPLVYFLHFRVLHQEKWDNPAQELSYQYICIYLHIYINAVENIKLKKNSSRPSPYYFRPKNSPWFSIFRPDIIV
jgi:hypothetical protein